MNSAKITQRQRTAFAKLFTREQWETMSQNDDFVAAFASGTLAQCRKLAVTILHKPLTAQDVATLKVRGVSLVSLESPEWGTWGVMERKDTGLEIHGNSGGRHLHVSEAVQFWAFAVEGLHSLYGE